MGDPSPDKSLYHRARQQQEARVIRPRRHGRASLLSPGTPYPGYLVDPDAVLGVLDGRGPREAEKAVFGRDVGSGQQGRAGERDLFPQVLRLVRESSPRAVFVENLPGLLEARFDEYRAARTDRIYRHSGTDNDRNAARHPRD